MPSAVCTVNASSTINGVNVSTSAACTIALVDHSGVRTWSIACVGTDELHSMSAVNTGLVVNQIAKTATFTAPSSECALIFESVVNVGLADETRARFGVYVPWMSGATPLRLAAFGETTEGNAAFGWVAKFNEMLRATG